MTLRFVCASHVPRQHPVPAVPQQPPAVSQAGVPGVPAASAVPSSSALIRHSPHHKPILGGAIPSHFRPHLCLRVAILGHSWTQPILGGAILSLTPPCISMTRNAYSFPALPNSMRCNCQPLASAFNSTRCNSQPLTAPSAAMRSNSQPPVAT